MDSGRWPAVEKLGAGGEHVHPVRCQHGRLKEKGENRIVEGADDALRFAFLRRGVGTGEVKKNAMGGQEGMHGIVDELTAITRREDADGWGGGRRVGWWPAAGEGTERGSERMRKTLVS